MDEIDERIEIITSVFTPEDKAFNARMVEEGNKIKRNKVADPNNIEDEYDFTSNVLR